MCVRYFRHPVQIPLIGYIEIMALYLITGIAGFIGSSIARGLLAQGHDVRGIDNFSTGRRDNITEITGQLDFREADLLNLDAVHDACRGVDYIFHEAAIPSVPKSVLDPLGSLLVGRPMPSAMIERTPICCRAIRWLASES